MPFAVTVDSPEPLRACCCAATTRTSSSQLCSSKLPERVAAANYQNLFEPVVEQQQPTARAASSLLLCSNYQNLFEPVVQQPTTRTSSSPLLCSSSQLLRASCAAANCQNVLLQPTARIILCVLIMQYIRMFFFVIVFSIKTNKQRLFV